MKQGYHTYASVLDNIKVLKCQNQYINANERFRQGRVSTDNFFIELMSKIIKLKFDSQIKTQLVDHFISWWEKPEIPILAVAFDTHKNYSKYNFRLSVRMQWKSYESVTNMGFQEFSNKV